MWFYLVCLPALMVACAPHETAAPAPDGLQGAAAEATAIIQRAEATAVVLKAQAAATALIQQASQPAPPSIPAAPRPAATAAAEPPAAAPAEPDDLVAGDEPLTQTVELLGVGYAAEGAFIFVQFRAPPQVARGWIQGNVSVINEAGGAVYNEVPAMPLIGPLIAHPAQPGQLGYVMLVNTPPGLPPGSLVTVILGDFKQEHVRTAIAHQTSESLPK